MDGTPTYWGLSVGFMLEPDFPVTVTAPPISIDPSHQSPWELGGRVLGISARISGTLIPRGIGFGATPGHADPDDSFSQYGDCGRNAPAAGSGERLFQSYFGDLHTECWNALTYPLTGWTKDSVISFGWGAGAADGADNPFDFCLSEIRPILKGDGPDEPPG